MEDSPFWIDQAAAMPVAFAQVRENALIDQWVVRQLTLPVDVMIVASGGCTAALLVAEPNVRSLHLVDPNPAQLALARMKLWLMQIFAGAYPEGHKAPWFELPPIDHMLRVSGNKQILANYASFPTTIEALCPPKPKLLLMTTFSGRWRGSLGV